MNIKILINKTFKIILLITLCTFLIVWCVYFLYGISDPVEKTLSITVGFFGGFATLGAAYIAANLFNDWKDQHNTSIISEHAKKAFNLIHNERNIIYEIGLYLKDIEYIDQYNIFSYRNELKEKFKKLGFIYNTNREDLNEFVKLTENSEFYSKYLNYGNFLNTFKENINIERIDKNTNTLKNTEEFIKKANFLNNELLDELKKYIFVV